MAEFENEVREIIKKINQLTLHYVMGSDEIKLKMNAVNNLIRLIKKRD